MPERKQTLRVMPVPTVTVRERRACFPHWRLLAFILDVNG